MTLSQFYFSFVRPVWAVERDCDPKTLVEYETSLAYWQRFTGDPALEALEQAPDQYTSQFLAGLRRLPGRKGKAAVSVNTVRKHVRQVQTLLHLAGPRSSRQPKGQGLIGEAPYIHKPRPWRKPAEDSFTLAEIGAILQACPQMKRPKLPGRLIAPGQWWANVITFAYNTGQRRQLIFGCRPEHVHGEWLDAPAEICKGHQPRRIYLNEAARAAVAAMKPGAYPFLFPWPGWPASARWLQENLRRLLAAAGLPPERHFGWHGFRKAAATELAQLNPVAAQMQLGHTSLTTTREHYLAARVLCQAVDALPQPPPPGDRRQQ